MGLMTTGRADIEPEDEGSMPLSTRMPMTVDLDDIVDRLQGLCSERTLDLALAIGELLVHELYRDIGHLRAVGARHAAYRSLLQHPRLTVSSTTLWRSMRVYELCERLPWLKAARCVTISHMYAVLGTETDVQQKLLANANQQGWTAEEVARRAKLEKRTSRRGRRGALPIKRAQRCLEILRTSLEEQLHSDGGGELTLSDKTELEHALHAMRELFAQVEALLHPLEPGE